jgi:hypothetical protein
MNCTYRWYLTRQINILGQLQHALLKRAFQIDLLHLLAQVRFLIDEGDEAVFDLEVDLRALLDVLGEVTLCGDGEGFATAITKVLACHSFEHTYLCSEDRN